MNSTLSDGLLEKEEKKGNYSVLIILIVIFLVMLIAVVVMQWKKQRTEKRLEERGDKIEMRKHSSESNHGLLNNDAVAMNKKKGVHDDMLISPLDVRKEMDASDDVDDEYELTSTDNEIDQ